MSDGLQLAGDNLLLEVHLSDAVPVQQVVGEFRVVMLVVMVILVKQL